MLDCLETASRVPGMKCLSPGRINSCVRVNGMGLLIHYSYYMMMKKAVREDFLTALIGLIDQDDRSS